LQSGATPSGVQSKTGDHNEPDHIEADKESHGRKSDRELFCVTEKDLEFIDIDDLY
jgi:hypothetical protein